MPEVENSSKKKSSCKSKKKQGAKKGNSCSGRQSNSSKGASNVRTADSVNKATSQAKSSCLSGVNRNQMSNVLNSPYVSTLGNSITAPPLSMGSGNNSSVYGYGGLPIAPPTSGNSANFLGASTHIPPAQRAGPYIPYFPQSCKPS